MPYSLLTSRSLVNQLLPILLYLSFQAAADSTFRRAATSHGWLPDVGGGAAAAAQAPTGMRCGKLNGCRGARLGAGLRSIVPVHDLQMHLPI